jgi:restriction system protein
VSFDSPAVDLGRSRGQYAGPLTGRTTVAVPDFQSIMLPLLELAADGGEHSLSEAREHLAERLGLSEDDRAEMLPSGRQRRFDNRVAWAKSYLQQAGALDSPRRAHFRITERGRRILGGQAGP